MTKTVKKGTQHFASVGQNVNSLKRICAFKHATIAFDDEETKVLKVILETLEKENKTLRMTVKKLEESFEKRIKAETRDKELKVDEIKQKFKILEETLQVQTTKINKKIYSAVVELQELPPTKLNDDEPAMDISRCINYPCDKCDFDFNEED